ncbi:IS481 family transposase [Blastococcus sp. BMG 814]|uniref:IS481 family transposase n=1 Tax=Blastococcus carthaginiensis TaxID=3050034 RepID=A0ABT9IIR0_9ACTN|nr:IS481 family transposase [Blastococcus carthaginiensis]MDP5184147.1 IS481 family transposase [Blastococcus carthaginiensis]MDP5185231.1 IS481 family transposase [Blastococcus carthaginiensis]MDP5185464.1 IS481 family transposase [Blastococcus carthaginiensis]MDP5185520.1 IS481 family transposase [Blastococcus carthaginiensis]
MSHGNARTTFHGRKLIVARWQNGWTKAHIAAAMGLSRKCVRTWITRYQDEGEAGLVDRSSRPHTSPRRTTAETEQRIVELRGAERRGPAWIGAELGVPARTVSRVLRRHGQPRLAALDPMTGEVIRFSKQTAVRYERARPGELVHMDVKKLARIPDGGGWRAHGRVAVTPDRSRAQRSENRSPGYDYVHSLVDDHSRLAYSEILPDEKGTTCAAFLTRAAAYFTAHGITRIERVMTDNAWAYKYSLREVCAALGARQKFIRPHCPWQNGKVERLNRTLVTEWAYRQPFTSNAERAAALAPWLEHYNTRRRHSALGGEPPISRLAPT